MVCKNFKNIRGEHNRLIRHSLKVYETLPDNTRHSFTLFTLIVVLYQQAQEALNNVLQEDIRYLFNDRDLY